MSVEQRPLCAPLSIDFVIVGGGIAGLATALALVRAGHRALVVEKEDGVKNRGWTGIRLPPNMSKILFHWGLKSQLSTQTLTAFPIVFERYETGQFLGGQRWGNELLQETSGEFLLTTHEELHEILTTAATGAGVSIRTDAEVVGVNSEQRSVTLATGETLNADVIVGADGIGGRCRVAVTGQEECGTSVGVTMYDTLAETSGEQPNFENVPEEERRMYSAPNTVVAAFGNRRAAVGFPVKAGSWFALNYYEEDSDPPEGNYSSVASSSLAEKCADAEPKLQYVAKIAKPAIRLPIKDYADLEYWVDKSERLVLVGQAAHPFPSGSVQGGAMAVEDAAVLGKLFSHLSSETQIGSFLWAFQTLRQTRAYGCRSGEMANVYMQMLPDGEEQRMRDELMVAKHQAGKHVFDAVGDDESNPVWEEIRKMFAYDCEDEADEWWVRWGRLEKLAKERENDENEDEDLVLVRQRTVSEE